MLCIASEASWLQRARRPVGHVGAQQGQGEAVMQPHAHVLHTATNKSLILTRTAIRFQGVVSTARKSRCPRRNLVMEILVRPPLLRRRGRVGQASQPGTSVELPRHLGRSAAPLTPRQARLQWTVSMAAPHLLAPAPPTNLARSWAARNPAVLALFRASGAIIRCVGINKRQCGRIRFPTAGWGEELRCSHRLKRPMS